MATQPMHLHFDCTSGISGDMILGALADLGVPVERLQAALAGLGIGPFALRAERVSRGGIMGTRVHVEVDEEDREHGDAGVHGHEHAHAHAHRHGHEQEHEHAHGHHHAHEHHGPHRHLKDVMEILERAALPARAAARAGRAYRKLAEAEAKVHGKSIEEIHFHEVGAKDAIVDVAGAMMGLELLDAASFSASVVTVGSGTVRCHHGVMPVPAPATAELLRGLPTIPGPIQAEMVTPTGAAILATLLEENGRPAGEPRVTERLGYGAGSRDFEGHANLLRLAVAQASSLQQESRQDACATLPEHTVVILETEIDDMPPEVAGYLMERLLEDGAWDVQFSAVQMKKNRPALRVRVLCEPAIQGRLAERIFRETSTFGIRHQTAHRWCLERRIETVATPLGPVAVKLGFWEGKILKAAPEYEACRALARESGRPLAEIYELAREAARKQFNL